MDTYAGLKIVVADWLMRDDLVHVIPRAVRMAEASINRRLRVRQMIVTAASEVECRMLSLPNDWLESIRADIGGDNQHRMGLLPMDEYPARILSTGQPVTYTIVGRDMHFRKLPEEPTPIEVAYYAAIPALSDTDPTNWLLLLWPDIYLYGSLMHTAPYLKDDPRLEVWEKMFEKALAEAKLSDSLSYNGTRQQIRAE
jgi:hypothetical protein